MAAFSGPRDAAVMEAILKEMGVEDYEPNVINQMLEFSYSKKLASYMHRYNYDIYGICYNYVNYLSTVATGITSAIILN